MKPLSRLTVAAAVAAAFASGAALPAAADDVELRLGTGTPPSHVWTRAANRFAEEIETATDGSVTVAVFPAAQLGPESDILQQMVAGVVDMGIISTAATSAREPSLLGWFSPFLMDSVEDARSAAETEAAGEMLDELQEIGIRGLGYVFAGMRHILMADTEVTGLQDLQNQKIRITPFPGMQVWWQGAGGVPTPVQLADVYQSLQSGLLDGVDIDLDALVGFSMQDAADYLIVTSHMAFPGVAMITDDAWNRLDEDQKAAVERVMDETLAWAADEQIKAESEHMAFLGDKITIVELDDAEATFASANEAFQDRFGDMPIVKRFQEQVGGGS